MKFLIAVMEAMILRKLFERTPASLAFYEEMLYSCSVSSFSRYQPAYASWRTILYVEEMARWRFAIGQGRWSWMNVLVNIFVGHAHIEVGDDKATSRAIL